MSDEENYFVENADERLRGVLLIDLSKLAIYDSDRKLFTGLLFRIRHHFLTNQGKSKDKINGNASDKIFTEF